ncbi:MAG: hypothetical protein Kow0081_0320 [Candidatus Dojkabacteria bacterium]
MKIINPTQLANSNAFSWTKEYLLKYLTTGKNPALTNPKLIMAFKNIDRKDFVTFENKNIAYADLEINLGYNEKLTRPSTLARMAELINPKTGGTYLDIGSGTGYFATILGYAIGNEGKVYSLERLQWLWEMARSNIAKYKEIKNVIFLYRDGMNGFIDKAPYDGIHVSFAVEQVPQNWKDQLKANGGILVVPTINHDIRVIERNGEDFIDEIVPGFIFDKGKVGVG